MGSGVREDRFLDDLDVRPRPEECPDGPGLIAEDSALELEAGEQRTMERLPGRRGVVEETRMGGDRLATRLADVGDVVERRQPGPFTVRPDALTDDGQDLGWLSRTHQGGESAWQDPVVCIVECDPFPARDPQPPVPGIRDPAIGGQAEEDDAWIAFREGGDQIGRPIGGSVVDDDTFERDVTFREDGPKSPLDGRGRVPARDQHTQAGGVRPGLEHGVDSFGHHDRS